MTIAVTGRAPVQLSDATPVAAAGAGASRRNRFAAAALATLAVVLVVSPFAFSMFAKTAAAGQMLTNIAPLVTDANLAKYQGDLDLFAAEANSLRALYQEQHIAPGTYPLIDSFLAQSNGIQLRDRQLLTSVGAATGDVQRLNSVSGLDRLPLLLVAAGLVAGLAAAVVWRGDRGTARRILAAAAVAGVILASYPFVSGLAGATRSADSLLDRFAPIMTDRQVRSLQTDFVVLVGAVGEVDSQILHGSVPNVQRQQLERVQQAWPDASADFATLTGAINDNLGNFRQLESFADLSPIPRWSGFRAAPSALVTIGALLIALSAWAWPQTGKTRNTIQRRD